MTTRTIETLNGVQVVQVEDGRYQLVDTLQGSASRCLYRSLESALRTARAVAAENDAADAAGY